MFGTCVYHELSGMAPYFYLDHKLLGAQWNGAQSVLVLLIASQACQTISAFLSGTGSPAGGLIFSFNSLASASGPGDLLGVPDLLGDIHPSSALPDDHRHIDFALVSH
jgi:hypothetical protein